MHACMNACTHTPVCACMCVCVYTISNNIDVYYPHNRYSNNDIMLVMCNKTQLRNPFTFTLHYQAVNINNIFLVNFHKIPKSISHSMFKDVPLVLVVSIHSKWRWHLLSDVVDIVKNVNHTLNMTLLLTAPSQVWQRMSQNHFPWVNQTLTAIFSFYCVVDNWTINTYIVCIVMGLQVTNYTAFH